MTPRAKLAAGAGGLTLDQEWQNVCDALAETTAGMSEEEILAECEAEGIDVKAEAARLRSMYLAVLDRVERKKAQWKPEPN